MKDVVTIGIPQCWIIMYILQQQLNHTLVGFFSSNHHCCDATRANIVDLGFPLAKQP